MTLLLAAGEEPPAGRFGTRGASCDASRVPPGWRAWLCHNGDTAPSEEDYRPREWQKPHEENLTGTAAAYRPKGSQLSWGQRPAATGDYVPWTPGE